MSDDEIHTQACIQCRRKKRKCSKKEPCQSCVDSGIECYYVDAQRRGAKPGAIESLKRRVEQLETMFVAQSMMLFPQGQPSDVDSTPSLEDIRDRVLHGDYPSSPKKRRLETKSSPGSLRDSFLPSLSLLRELCRIYFKNFHPWVPILHETRFMATVGTSDQSVLILQAITAITVRFSHLAEKEIEYYYTHCRETVILASMDEFSVETLQAITIIAYDIIGNGRGPRSWSVISSATRIVEQLGLAVEEDEETRSQLLGRMGFLNPSTSKTELEERRRLFWSIFLMDRFCSVTTGWGTSLTGAQVRRRLPIDGGLWKQNVPKVARYFNITEADVDPTDTENCLGGYAYLIEATDILSRVANFLLQAIKRDKNEEIKQWLHQFRQLDAMLTRWKTYLPAKWQSVRLNSEGSMDENLTLAHVTFNTSVLLLHQNVAYPPPKLGVGMPSKSSAERCLSVAREISTITKKFLAHVTKPIAPQFALCAFVAARTMLAHSRRFHAELDGNFNDLIHALLDMSQRWKGNSYMGDDLAGKFAARLENARDLNLEIDASQPVMEQSQYSMASPPFTSIFQTIVEEPNPDSLTDNQQSWIDFDLPDVDQSFTWDDDIPL